MSVALNNGASVVAFIGLTAQALHGILFIYEIVENIKEAPADLRCIYQQLKFFQLAFSTFRESVAEAERLGILARLSGQTRLALDDAEETITELQLIVQKYGEGRATNLRKRIKVALRRKRIVKLSQRLSNVSAQVNSTHTGIALMTQIYRPNLPPPIDSDLENKLLVLGDNVSAISSATITQQFEKVNQVLNQATESIIQLITDLAQKIDQIPYNSSNLYSNRGALQSTLFQQRIDINSEIYSRLESEVTISDEFISNTIDAAVRELFPSDSDNESRYLHSQEIRAVFRKSLLNHHPQFRSHQSKKRIIYIFFKFSYEAFQPAPLSRISDALVQNKLILFYSLYVGFLEGWSSDCLKMATYLILLFSHNLDSVVALYISLYLLPVVFMFSIFWD